MCYVRRTTNKLKDALFHANVTQSGDSDQVLSLYSAGIGTCFQNQDINTDTTGSWLGFQSCGCRFSEMLNKTDNEVTFE